VPGDHGIDNDGDGLIDRPASASCDSTAQPGLRSKMTTARDAFIAACGQPTGSYHTITGKVTITGVGFFDRIRGQRGVAPDGIELHPRPGLQSPILQPRVIVAPRALTSWSSLLLYEGHVRTSALKASATRRCDVVACAGARPGRSLPTSPEVRA
jgi:hypothetical protein